MSMDGGLLKKVETAWLFAFYGSLLTPRQNEALKMYLEEDLSLSEIAVLQGITRQGVHEAITRASVQMRDMEMKLNMAARFRAMHKGLEEALAALSDGDIQKARGIILELKRRDEEEENGL